MKLVKSVFSLRSKKHLDTRLQIRDERSYATRLIPWLAIVDISFAIVDSYISTSGTPLKFFGVRIASVVISRILFLLLRGRARYGMRLFVTVAPYIFGVEYIMISENFTVSPYFAGLGLVLITSTMLFPTRFSVALTVYSLCILPVIGYYLVFPLSSPLDMLNVILMSLGSVIVCSVNSGQVYRDMVAKYILREKLAKTLGMRHREIESKARELVKRRIFESQFSPQVVQYVLREPHLIKNMKDTEIVTIVIDIEGSTGKANTLHLDAYKTVVEEVLDVFAAACLKWNITVDRFTGDGVMAFSGAPVKNNDDVQSALSGCLDTMIMLQARMPHLEKKWQGPLNVRFGICEGLARVGFIGRGVFKTYTAISDSVSFAHRLSSVAEPWTIAFFSIRNPEKIKQQYPGFIISTTTIEQIKGFGNKQFKVAILRHEYENSNTIDVGRCTTCGTPLVMMEQKGGLPSVVCPACSGQMSSQSHAS